MTGVPPTIAAICNAALLHVEHTRMIEGLGDGTPEAEELVRHWDAARRYVLTRVRWHSATRFTRLDGRLEGELAPARLPNVYQLPGDTLKVVRLPDVARQIWRVAGRQNLLFTVYEPPLLIEEIFDLTDAGRFDPELVEALALYLAFRIAPRFSRSQNRAEILLERFNAIVEEAGFSEGVEGGDTHIDPYSVTDWVEAASAPFGSWTGGA